MQDIGPRSYCMFLVCLASAALPATSVSQTTYAAARGMPVSIDIVFSCAVRAADLDFAPYDSDQNTPVQGQTTIQLLCRSATAAEVILDAGTGPGGSTNRRRMELEGGRD